MTPNTTRVLVIDDHQLTRSLLRSLLREAGYTTQRECGEALSGIKLANHFRPHLICLDVQMPKMTGIDAIAALRAAAPDAAIVMVTGSADRDTVVSCIDAGANGYIIKPFNGETVLRAVEAALSKASPAAA
ncbi:response regulator [Aquabacterium humicola]|uniref:response regulator n=1 Tax=Aquabacterium humicola TaxID=3237377 RepID=UPI002543A3BD|nr:response regulator [Rubrivivax pictus]